MGNGICTKYSCKKYTSHNEKYPTYVHRMQSPSPTQRLISIVDHLVDIQGRQNDGCCPWSLVTTVPCEFQIQTVFPKSSCKSFLVHPYHLSSESRPLEIAHEGCVQQFSIVFGYLQISLCTIVWDLCVNPFICLQ